MTTTIELSHKNYIADLSKVCKVSNLISQICQIRGLDWFEKTLLNRWSRTVLNKQDLGTDVAFIFAKASFIEYLKSDRNVMNDDPITPFLIDCIKYV